MDRAAHAPQSLRWASPKLAEEPRAEAGGFSRAKDRRTRIAAVSGLQAPARMSNTRIALGKTGEDLACRELERRGYAILARRWRQRGGEIDIIAKDGATTVFVEVKARDGRAFGDGVEAVTARKQRRIVQLALLYLARYGLMDKPCRFDVVSIAIDRTPPVVEVFANAFDAGTT